jgi:hypothetical protein
MIVPRRYSIACLMALVAVVAIDCAVVRAPLSGRPVTEQLMIMGGLPMANTLAAGLLPFLIRPGLEMASTRNQFWRGFETVGWSALLLFSLNAVLHPEEVRVLAVQALWSFRSSGSTVFALLVSAALSLPQVLLALIGGWLNQSYPSLYAEE